MSSRDLGALLLLSALWGGSFLFMRVAAPSFGPILLIFLRVGLAGLALLAYALATRRVPPLRERWREYLMIGAINSALPFVLISWAELRLPASLAATLNATTPLFGAVVAALWMGEALTAVKIIGLLLGFSGVAVLAGLGPLPLTPATLQAMGGSLLAALSYGIAAVYTKVKVQGGQPQALALYSQLFAAAVLMPLVPFALPSAPPPAAAVVSLLTLAFLSTAFAYLLYFYLIVKVGPTRATMVTYLAPAFGMLWGAIFLKESLGVASFVGFALILASVALVSRSSGAAKAPVAEPEEMGG